MELGILSNTVKVMIGFCFGSMGLFLSYLMRKKIKHFVRETLSSASLGLIYTTAFIAGGYYELWNIWVFFTGILILSLSALWISAKFQYRISAMISLIGFLLSPLFFNVPSNKIIYLCLYLSLVSILYVMMSLKKSWLELRAFSFIGSWFVYYSYVTANMHILNKGSYLIAGILIYFILSVLLIIVLTSQNKIHIFDYLLSIYNGFLLVRYLPYLSESWYIKSSLLLACGIIYIISALLINYLFENSKKFFLLKFILGSFFILSATTVLDFGKELVSIHNTSVWIIALILLIVFRNVFNIKELKGPCIVLWLGLSIYWFSRNFNAPTGKFFSYYLPILNWSGLISIILASIGFLMVSKTSLGLFKEKEKKYLPVILGLCSHILVCDLLVVQTNIFLKEYKLFDYERPLILTLIWALYSLILLIRAIYMNVKPYKSFSLFMLLIAIIKAFFIDLSSSQSVYKMIFLFILGIITLTLASLNKKWRELRIEKLTEKI